MGKMLHISRPNGILATHCCIHRNSFIFSVSSEYFGETSKESDVVNNENELNSYLVLEFDMTVLAP